MTAVEIDAVRADITTLDVDAVVNAANSRLRPGAGVCGAIFGRAGARLVEACEAIGGCATGDAVATPGFGLPARWVIHAVGPVWQGGHVGEADRLASCYRRALEVADQLGARSVAFPAISTGVYGYPPVEAAAVAVHAIRSTAPALTVVERVVLVAFDTATLDRYVGLISSPCGP
jgi:O-acetyl-ADP-ribose deacetylase